MGLGLSNVAMTFFVSQTLNHILRKLWQPKLYLKRVEVQTILELLSGSYASPPNPDDFPIMMLDKEQCTLKKPKTRECLGKPE